MSETYRMEKVADFAQVPVNRLDDCLREFGNALRVAHATIGCLDAVADELDVSDVEFGLTAFEWMDDGCDDKVTIRVLGGAR